MTTTFWKVSKESKIEIPEIQRDYAQGRQNDRVNVIRKGFVKNLVEAVHFGTSLNLDFVFGQSIDRTNQANFNKNKQSLEQMLQVLKQYSKETGVAFESKVAPKPISTSDDKLLIPFDGQQRLTTLFLLHLYIGVMAKKEITVLNNFNYKTRESSSIFINKLLENTKVILEFSPKRRSEIIVKEEQEITLLSKEIKNQAWFFKSWEKDPTVAGMLVMLDEIRKQAIEISLDVENAWDNLVNKEYISFDYFDIQEEGFDEDLYVKMNARGKGLTDFENFRAWLEKNYKNKLLEYNWIYKIDKQWLDLFWKSKNTVKDVDRNFLSFFKNMGLLNKLGDFKEKSADNYKTEKILIDVLNPKIYTSTATYIEHDVFNVKTLTYIFNVLEIIVSDKKNILNEVINEVWTTTFKGKQEKNFTELLLTEFDNLNLYHKTFFYAILRFLIAKGSTSIEEYTEQDWTKCKDWLRVSRNLIYNSRIDDSSAYIPAIAALSKLEDEKILDIDKALKTISEDENKTKWIVFFNKNQQKEECYKSAILSSSQVVSKWSELICKAENHFYFYGQIEFLFKLSDNDITKFEEYLNNMNKLFSKENLTSESYLLQCLFFAVDDNNTWLKTYTTNRFKFYKSSYGNSRERDENWRDLWSDELKLKILKHVLDSCDCEQSSIDGLINKTKKQLDTNHWKYFILQYPKMLNTCSEALFSISDDYKNIRLLEKTVSFSKQRELRSFYFYITRKELIRFSPFSHFNYFTGERGNFNPCFYFGGWMYKEVEYYIDCFFDRNNFTIKLGRRTEGEIDSNIQEKLNQLLKFEEVELNCLSTWGIPYDKLEENLELIFKSLNEL